MLTKAAEVIRCQSWPFSPTMEATAHGDGLVLFSQEDQGNQVVVPQPQELEDGKGCQCRDGERQDQLDEDGEVGSTIDVG